VAFEPCPNESHNLMTHIRLNRLTDVRILTAPLSDQNSLGCFQ
jgi:hypothetical protein